MRSRLRATTNLRSTVLEATERCGVKKEDNLGTDLEKTVGKQIYSLLHTDITAM